MIHEGSFQTLRNENIFNIVGLLKACATQKDLSKGFRLHSYIWAHPVLERNPYIASTLVNMYAKCGALAKAAQVFKELPVQGVVAWNALIAGSVQHGNWEEALTYYNTMQCNGHFPNVVTFTCALKACGSICAIDKGEEIHNKIVSLGILKKHLVLGNAIVEMYAKCGALEKAQQVLEGLPIRDMVTWSALIAGYAQHGQGDEALKCYDSMQCEGHSPDAVVFMCVLKACGSIGAAAKGKQIHDKVVSLGMLEKNMMVGSCLVDMYVKCGALSKAQEVLEELPIRDVVTWSALIAGYAHYGQGEEALKCFDIMEQEGGIPNVVTFTCAVKACRSITLATKGKELHDKIVRLGMLEKHIELRSALVDMYSKCGMFDKAEQMLKEFHFRDAAMWSTLIAGYCQEGRGKEALKCYDDMQQEGHSPDEVTFVYVLKACGIIGATAKGEEIHHKIVRLGILENSFVLGTALVDMYVKCGTPAKAQKVLEELSVRDVATWTALIAGYAQQGLGKEALNCYDSMRCEGHLPNVVTFTCALKACGSIRGVAKGEEIHNEIVTLGLLDKNIVLGSTLVDMYAKCGALLKAQQLFEKLSDRNVVTWSSLIVGYVQQGQGEEALKCYDSMLQEDKPPDTVTFICALKACASLGAATKGEQIHGKIIRLGLLDKDIVLGNTLVDMYAKCGALGKAHEVLKKLAVRDVVTWNALIAGYVQHGQGEEALQCFDSMQCETLSPNVITFTCALKACGSIGAAAKGEQIDDKIRSLGLLEKDILLRSTLIDMHAKCGALKKALELLEGPILQNVVTWNSLIGGCSQQGQSLEAFDYFQRMESNGVKPDPTTLVCILNACSHSGLSDQAEIKFSRMNTEYGIAPDTKHYNCMVDLFGRAGKFDQALYMIEKMPFTDYLPMWVSFLSACYKWEELKIGRVAFEQALHLDKSSTATYVYVDNI